MKIKFFNFTKNEWLSGLATGLMLGLAFPPFPFYYLLFVALVPYLILLSQKRDLAEINRFTYYTFFVFNLIALYWVGSWTKDADPFLMLSGIALLFFNPLLFLIPSTLYYFVKKNLNEKLAFWLFPFFWVAYEFLYSVTEFRFPWLTLGNGAANFTSFIQIADVIGVYGLSLLLLYVNVSIATSLLSFRAEGKIQKRSLLFAVVLIVLPLIYGAVKLNEKIDSKGEITVGLIQPDFNPWKKWDAGNLDDQLKTYFTLSRKAINHGAEIIVWPETALPVYLLSGSYFQYVNGIRNFLDSNNVCLVTGMPHVKFFHDSTQAPFDAKKSEYGKYYYATYNSVLAFQPKSREVQQYGKIKLVPFGEKVPYVEYFPLIGKIIKWNVGISSWNVGRDTTVFTLENCVARDLVKVAPLICIESIYPDFVAQFVKKGAEFISVVTNDSWYGNSSGPYQHKAFAALRAVENRRFVVRAANGGISTIIDWKGRTLAQTKMFEKTFLVGKVKLNNAPTFYTNHPLLIPFAVLGVLLLLFGYLILKRIIQKLSRN